MNRSHTERRRLVVAMTRDGHSIREIAEVLDLTPRSVQRHRHDAGITRPPNNDPLTAEECATARALLEDGASYREVARTLGRSAVTLRRRLPGYGWDREQLLDYLTTTKPLEGALA
ncbi:helix-turn-helix DNA-binding domain protein [Mycobacterium phage Phrappuccino]|uniref:Helix-turn-helix DNA-binding domain protein n=1 Tax=Mycobacterium phage Phrappuccino TaxID=2591223 RepID=A0A514DE06_9CAUD|nr:DNA binding protein [Mycobacterium phage Phrappuccino]QDH91840.1 helix-turn-helix DNA-binding domain protein [Mycobacterium phage Phrappuccino]QIQ63282.1 helix-turn-helix DNA-binding domain protein [Mycobacterium phage Settecandela]